MGIPRKISQDIAEQITKEYKEGKTQQFLADKYNIARSCISYIISCRTYNNGTIDMTQYHHRKGFKKLNPEIVKEIRKRVNIDKETTRKVAEFFNVSPSTVSNIANYYSWTHVED